MSNLIIPQGYRSPLSVYEMQRAIEFIKSSFQVNLGQALNLRRVSAPLFVEENSGLNDNLNGYERPVGFDIPDVGENAQVVHSLAKWKRLALKRYEFNVGKGLFTDMNAIRRDEITDNLHSIYVDQWDWELTITEAERNLDFLKAVVRKIYSAMIRTEFLVSEMFPVCRPLLPKEITFIHTEDAQREYPQLAPEDRERVLAKRYGAIFLIGIGSPLADGKSHGGRAPDYDDWSTPSGNGYTGLNGDIVVWDSVRGDSMELSSMGIRVDRETLIRQLAIRGMEERASLYWHQRLLGGELPLSIGGGFGQSRLCMYLLKKAHIGEVQASVWPTDVREEAKRLGIFLL